MLIRKDGTKIIPSTYVEEYLDAILAELQKLNAGKEETPEPEVTHVKETGKGKRK